MNPLNNISKIIEDFYRIIRNKEINILMIKFLIVAIKNSTISFIKKQRDYSSEIFYFERKYLLNHKRSIKSIQNIRKSSDAFPKKILEILFNMKHQLKSKKLKVLEIGTGPVSNLAYFVDKGIFKVIGIDPLAEIYKNIMRKLNYTYPIIPLNIKCENLLNYFKKPCFDLVYALNSIDHTENSVKCIKNAYKLLKKGGILFLCSNIKEGSRNYWTGLHKYDLYFYNNRLSISNQKNMRYYLEDDKDIKLDLIYYKELKRKENIKYFKLAYKKL